MKMGRRKRIRLNLKRFAFSITIFIIISILITVISKKIIAKKHNKYKKSLTKEKVAHVNSDQKEEMGNSIDKSKGVEKLKDGKKVDNSNKARNYKEMFKDSLFLGDSITDSLSFYEFIGESNVIAKFGLTCKGAKDMVDKIAAKNPSNIFIMFGMNDILTGEDSKQFANSYVELIDSIKERLPDATIYVQSILPVDLKVKNKKPLLTNENINEFNQSLMDMAEDEGIEYLSIREILEQNDDLLEPDGIHVKYKFYKLWLDYLTDNIK